MPPKKAMGKGGKAPPEPAADDGAERALMESELLVAYMKSKLGRWGRCDVGGCAFVRVLVKLAVWVCMRARMRACRGVFATHGAPAGSGAGAACVIRHPPTTAAARAGMGDRQRCKHARAHLLPAHSAAESHAQQHNTQHPRPQVPGQWGQAAAGEPAPGRGPGHPAPQPAGHQRVPHERAEGAVPDHQRAGGQAARPDQGHGGGAQEQRGGGGAHAGAERAHGRSCSRSRTH